MIYSRLTPIFSNPPLAVTGDITHFCQKISFATDCLDRYHNTTTARSAAKPSRHLLAIFMLKTYLPNKQRVINSINRIAPILQASHIYHTKASVISYGGLSEPNKRPFKGNKFRRLNAVVNNPSPSLFKGDNLLTKRSGGYHA